MKILIVFPKPIDMVVANYNYSFPVGLAYISSAIKKAGYSVDCLNLWHQSGLGAELFNRHLDSTTYSFVCTGQMSVGYAEIAEILNLAREHKSKPRTILGGPIITTNPEMVYSDLQPTYGVLGEGEETVVELLDFVINKKDLREVNGIIYRDDTGDVIKTPNRKEIKDLDLLPLPDCDSLGYYEQISHETYQIESNIFSTCVFDHIRPYYVVASRSCPYQCTFCYHDSKFRQRSMENVFSELSSVVLKHKINYISVMDEIFATKKNKTRILDFCERIKALQKTIDWNLKWECQIRVDSVDRELLKTMKEAGCQLISYGFETISPAVIKSMRKNITPEQIDRALHDTLNEKITIQGNFIFGDVAETTETANCTFDYFENNCEGQVHLCLLQPYPGSAIYKQSVVRGLIPNELEFMRQVRRMRGGGFYLNMTNNMSDEDFRQMMRKIDWLLLKHRKATMPEGLMGIGKNLYHLRARCPYCRAYSEYNLVIRNSWHYDFKRVCGNCNYRFFIMSTYDYVVHALSQYEAFYLARRIFAEYIAGPPRRLYYGRVRPFLKVFILSYLIRKLPFLKRRFEPV